MRFNNTVINKADINPHERTHRIWQMKTEVLPQWIQKNKKKLLARADSHHMVVADQNQTKATVNKELHYYAFIMNAKGNTMAENDDRNYQSGSQESETSRPDRRRLEEEEQI